LTKLQKKLIIMIGNLSVIMIGIMEKYRESFQKIRKGIPPCTSKKQDRHLGSVLTCASNDREWATDNEASCVFEIIKKKHRTSVRCDPWRYEMINAMNRRILSRDIEQATSVVCRKKSSILKYAVQIIVLSLLFVGLCPAQTQFALAIGGADDDWDNSATLTFDGGYIVTGKTRSFGAGGDDLFLGKFNSSGDLTWAKTVGGADWDEGNSVAQTPDGGYVVTGRTRSFGAGDYDLFLCKFNSSGDLTWTKTVGGANWDEGKSVAPTPDGGYIVTGRTRSFGAGGDDLFLAKFNSSGDLTWVKTVGGRVWDWGNSVALTSDGEFIVTGMTRSFGGGDDDLFLAKFNSSGDLNWAKTLEGADWDEGNSVAQTFDGGYIVTGMTRSFGVGDYDLFLGKFDSSGDLTWAKTLGGADKDEGNSVAQTFDGGYIVTGKTWSFGAGWIDLFLGKFNSSGELTWAKTVGGTSYEYGNSVTQTPDGGYIVTGRTTSFGAGSCDLFFGKFSSSGEIRNCSFVADCSPVVGSPFLSSVSVSPTITVPGWAAVSCNPVVSSPSPTITKICPNFIAETLTKPISFELTVSPNPFNSSCAIMVNVEQSRLHRDCVTVEIFDLHGRLVWNKPSDSDNVGATSLIKGGKPEAVPINNGDVAKRQGISASAQGVIIWQPEESISSGVYLVRATTDVGQQITKRIVYLK
jgi:uncharacterized delta-60 repeat protein